ncbi:unnamed protein product [Peniophora sp. CBMAI 1063]|nr:unnamed protein product [Peniophora sp. CBMAI 1063]
MAAVDPSFPALPIAFLLSAVLLLFVLLTSFMQRSWNLGITFLCFWLFVDNITTAINMIIWSDNADIKLYVYCDIVTHTQVIAYVVKPMATLIITRRLYMVASLQSTGQASDGKERKALLIEWTLGLVIPLLVAGPLYYVEQTARFQVVEGFGCGNARDSAILDMLILQSWNIIPPLLSVIIYYPRVARVFFLQYRDSIRLLRGEGPGTRKNHLRILALASIDILFTLPIGIASLMLNVKELLDVGVFPFYPGWSVVHNYWEPLSVPYSELQAIGSYAIALQYITYWASPTLAFAIFGLFGLTVEARTSYSRLVEMIAGRFQWRRSSRAVMRGVSSTTSMDPSADVDESSHETLSFDVEMGFPARASLVEGVAALGTHGAYAYPK